MDEGCTAKGAYVVADDHVCDSGGAGLVYDSLVDEEGYEVGVCAGVVVVDVVCCHWCVLTNVMVC